VLSLISISLVVASGDGDEAKNVETVNDNYDDEESEDNAVADDADETVTDAPGDDDEPSENVEKTEKVVDDAEENNEDTVDVETAPIAKQKGKYMAYDDYQWQSAVDISDSNYNWNGEFNRVNGRTACPLKTKKTLRVVQKVPSCFPCILSLPTHPFPIQ
jgi:hypothetical protein